MIRWTQQRRIQHSTGDVSKGISLATNGDVFPSRMLLPPLTLCGTSPDEPDPLNGRLD